MKKYTLWYGSYVDLFQEEGIGVSLLLDEGTGKIQRMYNYLPPETTINLADLSGLWLGVRELAEEIDDKEVTIRGGSKYINTCLSNLPSWIEKGEIDLKCHSHAWKDVYGYLKKISSPAI